MWSTIEVVSKKIPADVPTGQITFFRFLVGGLIVLPLGVYQARRAGCRVDVKFLLGCLVLGILGVVLSVWLLHYSLLYLEAGSAAALFCSHPLWVALMAAPILGERPSKRVFAGILSGVVGVVVVSHAHFRAYPGSAIGILLIISSGVLFALYTVLLKAFRPRGIILTFCLSAIFGSLVLLVPVACRTALREILDTIRANAWQFFFLAAFSTGLGYLCYFWGILHVRAASGTSLIYLKPVIAAVLATLFLREPLRVSLIVGVVLIVAGVGLAAGRAGGSRSDENRKAPRDEGHPANSGSRNS